MKTYSPKLSEIEHEWWLIDAEDKVLGRVAVDAARLLRGKHKPSFAPHVDTGDYVVITNASKARLTGTKAESKVAYRHSGYPGGLRETPYSKLMSEKPEKAMEKAVTGMLPKNRIGRAMAGKLKVYAGPEHPHEAQNPKPFGEKPPAPGDAKEAG